MLKEQQVGSAGALSDKFKTEGAFVLSFGGLSTFNAGLEKLVGAPSLPLDLRMLHEHDGTKSRDALEWFPVKNVPQDIFKSSPCEQCVLSSMAREATMISSLRCSTR